jgi:segregation and condensation protein B
MEVTEIKPIIEAALLASGQPMSIPQLETLFAADPYDPVTGAEVATALHALGEDCAGRGVELVEVASGFRYQVRQDIHPWVARMWTERPSRYSRALLETLALIAYRQPITRGEIEQVRGVTVSSHIIKTLEEREWIRVVGHRDTPGRPALFGTTRTFLDYFNLKSLDDLPPLADILNLDSMDPQLALDDHAAGAPPPTADPA